MSRGTVEILACQDEIVNLLDSGNTYKSIYRLLHENKKISVSYLHFCSLLRNLKLRKRSDDILKVIYEARSEFDRRIHKVKRIQTQAIEDRQRIISESSITSLNDDKKQQKQVVSQSVPQSSAQKKPTFEIVRLGDEAFETTE